MKNNLTDLFRGDVAPVKVLTLGYALPMALGIAVLFLGKPIQWGPFWPTLVLWLMLLHQMAMIIPLWRCAKGKGWSLAGVLARITAVFAALIILPLGLLTLKTTSLNYGDGSDCITDTRSAPATDRP